MFPFWSRNLYAAIRAALRRQARNKEGPRQILNRPAETKGQQLHYEVHRVQTAKYIQNDLSQKRF
jgi:DNA-binding response OmpR family regulator